MLRNDRSSDDLTAQIDRLSAEVARLMSDKADLEMLLENTTDHSTYVEAELERTVQELEEERRKLKAEQEVSERLLLNILPKTIADRLKTDSEVIAESFPDTTVLFADIADFTPLSSRYPAEDLVAWLNSIFSAFDALTDKHGLEKIKTIGDSYMVVGGLPVPRPDHAEAIAELALDMQATIATLRSLTGEPLRMRMGISTGIVVAGVIGTKKFIYDLWGDAVNIASRMESHGLIGAIQVTEPTYELLRHRYILTKRGIIEIKGKGEMTTYLLLGKR